MNKKKQVGMIGSGEAGWQGSTTKCRLWHRIVSLGTGREFSADINWETAIVNIFAVIGACCSLLYGVFHSLIPGLMSWNHLFCLGAWLFCLYCNYRKWKNLARILLVINANLNMMIELLPSRNAAGFQGPFLILFGLILIISYRHNVERFCSFTLLIFCLMFTHLYYSCVPVENRLISNAVHAVFYLNLVFIFLFSIAVGYVLMKATDRRNDMLLRAQRKPFHRKARKAQSALIVQKRKYDMLCNAVREALLVMAGENHVVDMNHAAVSLTGYSRDEIVKDGNMLRFLHTDSIKSLEHAIGNETERKTPVEIVLIHKQGHEIYASMSVTRYRQQIPNLIVLSFVDISDQKKFQEEKRVFAMNRQREFLSVMIRTRNEERKRLAENIHDSLGQLLTAARMNLSAIDSNISGGYDTRDSTLYAFNKNLKTAIDIIDEAMSECKAISSGLSLSLENDLVPAVKNLCNKMNQSEMTKVTFYSNAVFFGVNEMLHQNIYRMCQELINNAFKHAKASEISLQLFNREGHIIILVEDDGIGFDADDTAQTGMGLHNIRNRIKTLNGHVLIDSKIGRGSTIILEIPI